jgi:hypothetical protein
MKHQRSEEALKFIAQKKNLIIALGIAAAVIVVAALSFNYLQEQRRFDAKSAFGEALAAQSQDETMEILRSVTQEYSGSVYAVYSYMLLGLNYIDKNEYREAVVAFESALKAKQPAAFLTAQLWELKAIALEFDGSIDDAISAFQKSLSVSNNVYRRNEVLLRLALLNLKIGQNQEARKLFEEIVAGSSANERILKIAKNEISALEEYGY